MQFTISTVIQNDKHEVQYITVLSEIAVINNQQITTTEHHQSSKLIIK